MVAFESDKVPAICDGMYQGKELDNGIFVYYLDIPSKIKQKKC